MKAMPPKVKVIKESKESVLKKSSTFDEEEKRRMREQKEELSIEQIDLSAAVLQEKIKEAQEADQYWSTQQNLIASADQTISLSEADRLSTEAQEALSYWSDEQECYEKTLEEQPELDGDLTLIINACIQVVQRLEDVERHIKKIVEIDHGEKNVMASKEMVKQ